MLEYIDHIIRILLSYSFVCQPLAPGVLFSTLHIFVLLVLSDNTWSLCIVVQCTKIEMTWNEISLPLAAAMLVLIQWSDWFPFPSFNDSAFFFSWSQLLDSLSLPNFKHPCCVLEASINRYGYTYTLSYSWAIMQQYQHLQWCPKNENSVAYFAQQ